MAYIGQRPVIGRYIKLDQISSGFNGSNTGFSMTAGSQGSPEVVQMARIGMQKQFGPQGKSARRKEFR